MRFTELFLYASMNESPNWDYIYSELQKIPNYDYSMFTCKVS